MHKLFKELLNKHLRSDDKAVDLNSILKMSECKGTAKRMSSFWPKEKKKDKRLTLVSHIKNIKNVLQADLLTSCSLTHPSSQTSFPRQDLKTSIVMEFIKVLDESFDLTDSAEADRPVCVRALIKSGVQVQLQLAASATLICGTHTQREGGGGRATRFANKLSVSEHVSPSFPKPFRLPPPPRREGAVLLSLTHTHTSSAFQWSCVLSVCGYGSKADCWRRCQALQPIIKPGIHTGHTCLQDLPHMHCTSLQQKLLTATSIGGKKPYLSGKGSIKKKHQTLRQN